jgi:predicted lipid carrier protein YhbT
MSLSQTILSKAVNLTPCLLRIPAQNLPFVVQQKLFGTVLDPLLKQMIKDEALDFLDGKWLKIEVTDLDKQWYFTLLDGKLTMTENLDQADICFSCDMNSMVLLAAKKVDPDTLFFRRKLLITGDTELGLEVKNFIDNLELDNLPKPFSFGLFRYADMVQQHSQLC